MQGPSVSPVSALQLVQDFTAYVSRKLQKILAGMCAEHFQPRAVKPSIAWRHPTTLSVAITAMFALGAKAALWLFEAHDMGESSLRRLPP